MPDQGQLWSSGFQYGREIIAGAPVVATRKAYFELESALTVEQAANEHRFATGRPDNLLSVTPGPVTAGGTLSLPASSSELVELCECGVRGGVTPTTPAGSTNLRAWSFKPGGNLDSMTVEWDDGANVWQGAGARLNGITITGDASGTLMVSSDLFATDVIPMPGGVLTPALTDRVPDFLEGWQARFFLGSFGSTFNALNYMPGLLRNWTINLAQNNLGRVRAADNTLATRRIVRGPFGATAQVTFDAYGAGAIAEFNNWRANTSRMMGFEFVGPTSGIEAGAAEVQTWTVTGTPTGGGSTPSFMGVAAGAPVVFNSTAAQAQAVLRAIPTIGADGVVVTGGPWPGTPLVATFAGRWNEYDVPLMTKVDAFVGGTTPSSSIVQTTPGRGGQRRITVLLPCVWTADTIGGSADEIRTYEMSATAIYDPTLAAMAEIVLYNNRTTAFA